MRNVKETIEHAFADAKAMLTFAAMNVKNCSIGHGKAQEWLNIVIS